MIIVRNLYHMLSYAFDVLMQRSYSSLATESFDSAIELMGEILHRGVSGQIKRGLVRTYVPQKEMTNRIKGKVNFSESVKPDLETSLKVVCEFDEFTEDSDLNRILKSTILLLTRIKEVPFELRQRLRKLSLYLNGVTEIDVFRVSWKSIRYDRNNQSYRMLINICYLIVKGLVQIEKDGTIKLITLSDSTVMHALYERFLREYYRKEYKDISVSAVTIDWVLDDENREFLPKMNTDITLTRDNKKIIIDAKFYSRIMETNTLYGTSTYSSSNLYQIFSYVKNADPKATGDVSGILLYGKFNNEVVKESDFLMSGNKISVKFIDLNDKWIKIKAKLDQITSYLGV